MIIRTTLDPVSLNDIPDPENHPCVYEGDGDNGLEIYFETEENLQQYPNIEVKKDIVLQGNDCEDYVAKG